MISEKQREIGPIDVARFASGDRREFHACFESMYETLVFFTHRYTDDISQAEDCVQEAFISLWERHADMQSFAHIRAFLYRVCHNKAINALKHSSYGSPLAESCELEDSSADFLENMIREESYRLLAVMQQMLPPKCSQIFEKAVQGNDNISIARELGISKNTVKTQKKIAYKRMKSLLDELYMLVAILS